MSGQSCAQLALLTGCALAGCACESRGAGRRAPATTIATIAASRADAQDRSRATVYGARRRAPARACTREVLPQTSPRPSWLAKLAPPSSMEPPRSIASVKQVRYRSIDTIRLILTFTYALRLCALLGHGRCDACRPYAWRRVNCMHMRMTNIVYVHC